jgi:hypothetical protein
MQHGAENGEALHKAVWMLSCAIRYAHRAGMDRKGGRGGRRIGWHLKVVHYVGCTIAFLHL